MAEFVEAQKTLGEDLPHFFEYLDFGLRKGGGLFVVDDEGAMRKGHVENGTDVEPKIEVDLGAFAMGVIGVEVAAVGGLTGLPNCGYGIDTFDVGVDLSPASIGAHAVRPERSIVVFGVDQVDAAVFEGYG